ncbi:lipolytic enzyme [Sodiomyces alkalinus F11]|uniref:Lipolytic enzyme n=1 Tax=Sodiomyces alkalinus (strain CBS 110278 / VKM F-3762 / F11) TaxID=1314773 RepID=A0A3N2PQT4_SODAK|nr:lipolytic enzyme [Sodiomyces alkalinus F11]ROT36873.1 lipolytic enzyme [Sodiomyces alkalinus F11]
MFAGFSLRTALTALLVLGTATSSVLASDPCVPRDEDKDWVTVWGAMPQLTEPHNLPPVPFNETGRVFHDSTIRQTVKASLATSTLRLEISNAFGGSDLPITAVSVALPVDPSRAGGSAIQPNTAQEVTFSGSRSIIVPQGALVLSDPIDIAVESESILAISIYLADGQTTNDLTSHPGSRTTSWLVHGNHVADADFNNATPSDHWYLISALEAPLNTPGADEEAATIAIIGDSLTDGRGSTTNANNRWPDQLLARLNADNNATTSARRPAIAILNQGAGGNRVLADGLGPNAMARIDRDVLSHPGVRYVLFFIGVNDIGTAAAEPGPQAVVGDRLAQAFHQMATRLRRHGLAVFGATLTPMSGPGQAYGHPEREKTRQGLNEWIRAAEGTVFDAVVDFDAMVRDPENPETLAPPYNEGDHLHLSPRGYQAMADGFDLELFARFAGAGRRF